MLPINAGDSVARFAASLLRATPNPVFSQNRFALPPVRGFIGALLGAESHVPQSFWGRLAASRLAQVAAKQFSVGLRLEPNHGVTVGPRHLVTTDRAR
jgi:hypothetical protein